MSVSKSNNYVRNISLGVERIFLKVLNLLHVYIHKTYDLIDFNVESPFT